MKIAVIGAGYVGLVTAVCLAEKDNDVICYDVSKDKIEMLNSGKAPIFEPKLEALMFKNKEKLIYTSDKKKAYKDVGIIFVAVGTPENLDGSVNLDYIYKVANDIIENINQDCLIVIKSTVPVGTNYIIEKYIQDRIKNNYKIEIASNPEFLSQGTAIKDTLEAQRIIIGTHSKWAESILTKIYSDFGKSVLQFTDINSAEMIKYASNDFLALKISYINEIANLCELLEADIEEVTKGMGLDNRIGDKYLKAGIGYGGACFPKDTKALVSQAKQHNYNLLTVGATISVNDKQKLKLIEKARKYYTTFNNLNIAILGTTFKSNTDDLRGAPSLDNISLLIREGANITVYDPISEKTLKGLYGNKILYCDSIERTLSNTDICFIYTEWDFVKNLNLNLFKEYMRNPIVLDGRNSFKLENIPEGIIYESIGRRAINTIK